MGKKLKTGGRPLRIAYGRIFHEANSYVPLLTEKERFTDFHYFEGQDLEDLLKGPDHELVDMLRKAELTGFLHTAEKAGNVECIPLLSGLAVPGGPISAKCFEWLRGRFRKSLEEVGEVDGVYLALHGSMRVEGLQGAPEAVIIQDVRDVLGDVRLCVSYDLHGNLSSEMVDTVDLMEGFRTNPHRDLYQTGIRSGTHLIQLLRGEIQPKLAWRKLPVVLGGGITIDFLNPMRPVFRHIKKICGRRGVVSAHVFMVHPYTDAPDLGWAVHVCTDGDQALAEKLADELAEIAWKASKVPVPDMFDPVGMIDSIRTATTARKLGHVSIVDTADVVGAGSTGGNTFLLDAFVRLGSDLRVLVPIHDPRAVASLRDVPVGSTSEVLIRGTEGMAEQPEVRFKATISVRKQTKFGETLLLIHNEMRIAISEQPPGSVHPSFWRDLGESPWKADAIVQKFFFHYRMFYLTSLRKNIAVATDGPTSLNHVRNREFDMPVLPSSKVDDWRPFDTKRRATRVPVGQSSPPAASSAI